jgi:hypothetical protein
MLSKSLIPTCKQLQELYEKYGVKNLNDLALAINKPLMDSFGVKSIEALRDTLAKINLNRIEVAYQNGSISYNDLKYYVFNTSKLGFINIDAFAKLKPGSLVDLNIKFTPARNTECKIVFKKRKAILPGSNLGKNYTFKNIPKNEAVYIVALKYLDGQALLAIEEIKTAQITIEPNFQTYTLEELKEQLKKLDALGN